MNKKNIIIGLLVTLVIAISGYAFLKDDGVGASSGYAHWQMESFLQGVSAGARDQFSVSNVGALTSSGAVTLSSTLGVSGITSLTETLNVTEATGTSTITVKATAASTGGRIILEDSDGAGCSELYVLNGTLTTATVTCP